MGYKNKSFPAFLMLISTLLLTNYASAQSTVEITMQKFNSALHNKLPAHILKTKEIIVANNGALPPYLIQTENNQYEGINIDLLTAIGQILGVAIKHEVAANLPAVLMGIQNNRYDLTMGPLADFPSRQEKGDFIDFSLTATAIAVAKGNPQAIQSITDMCGKTIAVQVGSHAEDKLKEYSVQCEQQGHTPINILTFNDLTTAALAVKSQRADAVQSAVSSLVYYISQAKDALELVIVEPAGSQPKKFMGAVVAKGSPLSPILLEALQELFDNGTYLAIMRKWGLESQALDAPGINLAK